MGKVLTTALKALGLGGLIGLGGSVVTGSSSIGGFFNSLLLICLGILFIWLMFKLIKK